MLLKKALKFTPLQYVRIWSIDAIKRLKNVLFISQYF